MMNVYEMSNNEFEVLVKRAKDYNEVKDFIESVGYQEWMDNYSDADEGEPMSEGEIEEIDEILNEIFNEAHDEDAGKNNPVKGLKEEIGMTIPEFAEYFGIPQRTVLSWNCGDRECAEYLVNLMRYKAEKEGLIGGGRWEKKVHDGVRQLVYDDEIFAGYDGSEMGVVELWKTLKKEFPSFSNFWGFKKAVKK